MTNQTITHSIHETAKLCGLSQHTLRYYEKTGLIRPVARASSSNHRVYTENDVSILQSLSYLKMCGMSVRDMRTYADFLYTSQVDQEAMKELFVQHEQKFGKRIDKLRVQHKYIQCKVAFWEAKCAGDESRILDIIAKSKKIAQQLTN
jgi:DNA-binding transcriptional MerR regulator